MSFASATVKSPYNLINFALKNNLLISAGSDCHGDFNGDTRHGDIGCMDLEEKYLKSFCNEYYS